MKEVVRLYVKKKLSFLHFYVMEGAHDKNQSNLKHELYLIK